MGIGPDKHTECNPAYSELDNPKLSWQTLAWGNRALEIVRTYYREGLLGGERELKLRVLEVRLGSPIFRTRKITDRTCFKL